MKTIQTLALLTALTLFCCKAHAELGETPLQMEPGKPTRIEQQYGGFVVWWEGKNVGHSGLFIGNRAVIETFWFVDGHMMTAVEVARFLKPYYDANLILTQISHSDYGDLLQLTTSTGGVYALVIYEYERQQLSVWTPQQFREIVVEPAKDSAQPTKMVGI
jgi:hypothetical protein